MNAEDTSWIFFSVLINFLFVTGKMYLTATYHDKKKMEFQLTTVILDFFLFDITFFTNCPKQQCDVTGVQDDVPL